MQNNHLTFSDKGDYVHAVLRCNGQLDDTNFGDSAHWIRDCVSPITKPLRIDTTQGTVCIVPIVGGLRVARARQKINCDPKAADQQFLALAKSLINDPQAQGQIQVQE
jgi:hypothetical protein